jgi:hypothetical protein
VLEEKGVMKVRRGQEKGERQRMIQGWRGEKTTGGKEEERVSMVKKGGENTGGEKEDERVRNKW